MNANDSATPLLLFEWRFDTLRRRGKLFAIAANEDEARYAIIRDTHGPGVGRLYRDQLRNRPQDVAHWFGQWHTTHDDRVYQADPLYKEWLAAMLLMTEAHRQPFINLLEDIQTLAELPSFRQARPAAQGSAAWSYVPDQRVARARPPLKTVPTIQVQVQHLVEPASPKPLPPKPVRSLPRPAR